MRKLRYLKKGKYEEKGISKITIAALALCPSA